MVQALTCVPNLATSSAFVTLPFTCAPPVYSEQVFKGNNVEVSTPLSDLVDYSAAFWTEKEESLALAAIMHRSRVGRIVLESPRASMSIPFSLLNHPFPELESLEIYAPYYHHNDLELELILKTLPSVSAPSLRQLTLWEVAPRCLSPLLSSSTSLV